MLKHENRREKTHAIVLISSAAGLILSITAGDKNRFDRVLAVVRVPGAVVVYRGGG